MTTKTHWNAGTKVAERAAAPTLKAKSIALRDRSALCPRSPMLDLSRIRQHIKYYDRVHTNILRDGHDQARIGIVSRLDCDIRHPTTEAIELNNKNVYDAKNSPTLEQIDKLFECDLEKAVDLAHANVPNFDDLSDDQKGVLVDMAYSLGRDEFQDLVAIISAIEKGDLRNAVLAIERSKWRDQLNDCAYDDTEPIELFWRCPM